MSESHQILLIGFIAGIFSAGPVIFIMGINRGETLARRELAKRLNRTKEAL